MAQGPNREAHSPEHWIGSGFQFRRPSSDLCHKRIVARLSGPCDLAHSQELLLAGARPCESARSRVLAYRVSKMSIRSVASPSAVTRIRCHRRCHDENRTRIKRRDQIKLLI